MSTSLTPDQARAMASAALRDSRLRTQQQHPHPNSSEQDLNVSISDAPIRTFDDMPQTPRRQLFPEGGPVRSLCGTPGRRVYQEEAKMAAMKELHDAEVEVGLLCLMVVDRFRGVLCCVVFDGCGSFPRSFVLWNYE